MDILCVVLVWALIAIGLAGAFFPVIPSHLILLVAGISHYAINGKEDSNLTIISLIILGVMMAVSQLIETFSGSIGSRALGGSKWGALGGFLGVIVGLFFPPIGFLIGPLIGATLAERFLGKKTFQNALTSGAGSAAGILSGLAVRMIFSFVMTAYLLLDMYVF